MATNTVPSNTADAAAPPSAPKMGQQQTVITTIREAQQSWSGWNWTMDFVGDGDVTVYYDSRPLDDDHSAGARQAREYDDEVAAAAAEASDLGDQAIAAIEAGEYAEAASLLAKACRVEAHFGDCPAYRPARRLAEHLANGGSA